MFIPKFRLKAAVQKFLCNLQELLDFAVEHPVREMRKVALTESVEYIRQNMTEAIGVYTPRDAFDVASRRWRGNGHIVEFGVFRGGSIRYLASLYPRHVVHGFDSFEGLAGRVVGLQYG